MLIIYVNSMGIRILEDSNNTLLMPLTELAETKTKAKIITHWAPIPSASKAPDITGTGEQVSLL